MTDWSTLRRLADQQRGLLTRAQCLDAGLSDDALQWRADSHRWVRLHEGVYLTTPGRDDWRTTSLAALLAVDTSSPACGAAYAGHAAAFLWGLRPRPPAVTEIVVPHARRPSAS
ncbi:type IV toxin-antitoxin system AbiEi family antitoxin domain-containing protein [Knoellia sp. CPCC 206435]|uniref:type IV toxin-antitoxin system AbiEi family antitoxin domain-containing protein n=1 Tax=Knoellia terrae TaxID=3404797 RepID=UPI003B42F30C